MDNQQLAHDLAIAKLSGTYLPPDKMVEQYRKLYSEFSECLSNEPKPQKTRPTQIIKNVI